MLLESANSLSPALDVAFRRALAYAGALDAKPAGAVADASTLRTRLMRPLNNDPIDARQVIEKLADDVEDGLTATSSGRFFAWAIGGALPAALAADWLTSAWDQNAALYVTSPAAAIVEEVAGAWLKDLLGLPPSASFALVTGCQMAHVTCLAAARNALLAQRSWDVERRGLSGAPPIRIVSSSNRHGSIDRAIRMLGLGTDCIEYLEPAGDETIRPETLQAALRRAGVRPTVVLLEAGNLNTGVFDPFSELIPIARRYGAWVHVDGAFGLWAAASPLHRHLLAGVEAANSWATDGHKWLNVPFDCGYAFVANEAAHRAAVSVRAPYIAHATDARDEIDWNPEWSRRARGFATYAALRELGRSGIADLIERTCRYAREMVDAIGRLPNAEVLWRPIINQGLVAFGDDRTTEAVIDRVVASGEAFFGATTWRGRRAMRVSVLNWRTSQRDVERAIAAVAKCG